MPGVGTTTTARQVVEILRTQGIDARLDSGGSAEPADLLTMPRYRRNAARIARLASLPALGVATLSHARTRSDVAELLRLANREIARRGIEDVPHGLVLLDEGPLHKLCLIYAGRRIRKPLRLVGTLSEPELCIVLEAEPEEVFRRIRSRPMSSPVDKQPDEELVRYLSGYREGKSAITRLLTCPVIPVNALGQDVAYRTAAVIMSRLEA